MDYTFTTNGLTDRVAKMLANRKCALSVRERDELMNGLFRGLAILEYPTIDIELNVWDTILYGEEDDKIIPEYYVCVKGLVGDTEMWSSDDSADWDVNVDFSARNWRELLERDMHDALLDHAERYGYSLTEPNF